MNLEPAGHSLPPWWRRAAQPWVSSRCSRLFSVTKSELCFVLRQGRGKSHGRHTAPRAQQTLLTGARLGLARALGHLPSQHQVPAASACAGPSFLAASWWPAPWSRRGCGAGTHAPQVPRRQLESERGRHSWDGNVQATPASALRSSSWSGSQDLLVPVGRRLGGV